MLNGDEWFSNNPVGGAVPLRTRGLLAENFSAFLQRFVATLTLKLKIKITRIVCIKNFKRPRLLKYFVYFN